MQKIKTKIDKFLQMYQVIPYSRGTEVFHFFLFAASVLTALIFLLFHIAILNYTPVISFDNIPGVPWRLMEQKEGFLYHTWAVLLPLVAAAVYSLNVWLVIKKLLARSAYSPYSAGGMVLFSILAAAISFFSVFLFVVFSLYLGFSAYFSLASSLVFLSGCNALAVVFVMKRKAAFNFFAARPVLRAAAAIIFVSGVVVFSALMYRTVYSAFTQTHYYEKFFFFLFPLQNYFWAAVIYASLFFLFFRGRRYAGFFFSTGTKVWLQAVLVFLMLFVILFNPAFLYEVKDSFGNVLTYHYNSFIGPVHDVMLGKNILVDSYSNYGILMTHFLALIFKFLPLTYGTLYIILMCVTIMYYLGMYFFLRYWLKSWFFALVGIFIALSLTVLRLDDKWLSYVQEIYTFPSMTPLRYFFDVFVFWFLLVDLRKNYPLLRYAAYALSAVAVFYNFEFGISLAIAVFCYLVLRMIFYSGNAKNRLTIFLKELIMFSAFLAGAFLFINTFIFVRANQIPSWLTFIYHQKIQLLGFWGLPLPVAGPYFFVLALYLIFVLVLIYQKLSHIESKESPLYGAIAVYGIMIFHYYLNRSHDNNLSVVILPAAWLCLALPDGKARAPVRDE